MNLESVIARIAGACPEFKLVDGVAAFASLAGVPKALPACYVLPLSEVDIGDDDMDGTGQRVGARFGLCIAAGNVRSAGGRDALVDLRALRQSARAALLGWVPDECDAPALFDRGELMSAQAGLVWWQDAFRTAYPIDTE
jgi:hypothetical protein